MFETIVNQLSASIERNELSRQLHHHAFNDMLTNLPNRRRFEHELEATLAEPEKYGKRGAVLFMDLDGFKLVNDTLGHAVGDALLCHVSQRLSSTIPERDVLARMGGDEFAVILRDINEREHAVTVAQRLCDALKSPFIVDGTRLSAATSIGISHYPEHGVTADELVRHADVAMYKAKQEGKGRIVTFYTTLGNAMSRLAGLELELREAIDGQQFRLVFQPQVSCVSKSVVAVEALIRWDHPTRGSIAPNEFIPIAEKCGLIVPIGVWVIEQAIQQLAAWKNTDLRSLRMSVNISPSQFLLNNFPEQVLDLLKKYDTDPCKLEIELTESVLVHNLDDVVVQLQLLRSAGIRVAIDDFGTGYSSLSHLQDLPLDVLKIDRAFVSRLKQENNTNSLVNTILLMASGLALETVADGVETSEQQRDVTALGCDMIQGYYFSRPVEPKDLSTVVAQIQSDYASIIQKEHRRAV